MKCNQENIDAIDYELLNKILVIGDPDYTRNVIEKFTQEAFHYQKTLEKIVDQKNYIDLPRITDKFAQSASALGGVQVGKLCLELVNRYQHAGKDLTRSDLSPIVSAKDHLIAEMVRLKRQKYHAPPNAVK